MADLTHFRLERATFEARYAQAFLHWDRAGAVWTTIRQGWHDLRVLSADPSKTIFGLGRDYQLVVQLERATVIADAPPADLDVFGKLADDLIRGLSEQLEVAALTRVGFRLVWIREFPTQEEADSFVLNSTKLRTPPDNVFGITTKRPKFPVYGARFEGDGFGASVRIEADGRKITFNPPFGLKEIAPVVDRTIRGVTLDVDYYSTATIPLAQFRASEWLRQASHLIRRDVGKFLILAASHE